MKMHLLAVGEEYLSARSRLSCIESDSHMYLNGFYIRMSKRAGNASHDLVEHIVFQPPYAPVGRRMDECVSIEIRGESNWIRSNVWHEGRCERSRRR